MESYSTPKKMKQVSDLFETYKTRFKAPQKTVEKECIAVITTVTQFTLTEAQVKYTVSTRTIAIQAPSILKNELRFKQQQILQELENRLGKDGCPKVIL
jgi:hypothetical protein